MFKEETAASFEMLPRHLSGVTWGKCRRTCQNNRWLGTGPNQAPPENSGAQSFVETAQLFPQLLLVGEKSQKRRRNEGTSEM